jgi:hypothetical protein
MRKRMRGRRLPSAGVILGALALFISLGSGAVALQVSGIGAKALKKVTVRSASTPPYPAQGTHNGNYDSQAAEVRCKKNELALGGGTGWNVDSDVDLPSNAPLVGSSDLKLNRGPFSSPAAA